MCPVRSVTYVSGRSAPVRMQARSVHSWIISEQIPLPLCDVVPGILSVSRDHAHLVQMSLEFGLRENNIPGDPSNVLEIRLNLWCRAE